MVKPTRLIVAAALLLAAAVLLASLFGIRQAAQQAPEFYLQSLAADSQHQVQAAEQFELRTIALHNALLHEGRWSLELTQEEINGWLATELPAKFPGLLPRGVSQPRIAMAAHQVQLAARLEEQGVATIVSLVGDIHLTAQPNEVAVRLVRVRAGTLPMPLGKLIDGISELAASAGIPLRWTEANGDPVALLKIPLELNQRQFVLESLELSHGAVALAGHTDDQVPATIAVIPGEEKTGGSARVR